jgi:hypothetical protein
VAILTGKPAPSRPPVSRAKAERRRGQREQAAHRSALSMSVSHLYQSDVPFIDSARAVLDRWAAQKHPPPELEGWRRVLAENPNADSLAAHLTRRDTLMQRLLRRSPFEEILPREEREFMLAGIDCERGNP